MSNGSAKHALTISLGLSFTMLALLACASEEATNDSSAGATAGSGTGTDSASGSGSNTAGGTQTGAGSTGAPTGSTTSASSGQGTATSSTTGDATTPPSSGSTPPSAGGAGGADNSGGGGSGGTPPADTTDPLDATNPGAGDPGAGDPAGAGGSQGNETGAGGAPGAGGMGGAPSDGAGGGAGGSDATVEPDPAPRGGASAAAICEPGASYGDPLTGMGQVVSIGPPSMGNVTYFAFIEGPIWHAGSQTLFFSDNAASPQERIFKLVPPSTSTEVFMEESGSNGLALDNDDNLLLADQRNKRVTRVNAETGMLMGEVAPAGNYVPNDLIMRSDDNLYFTDLNSAGRGFYRVSPGGDVDGPLGTLSSPNGILLSADESVLYVGDMQSRVINAFDLADDGSVDVASGSVFATTNGHTLDGMATDCAGNLYAGTGEGVEVFDASGAPLGTIPTGESSNATFGGADRKTLYVTSRAVLKAVTLAVPGLPN